MADVDFGKLMTAMTPIDHHACGAVGDTCLDNILYTTVDIMLYIAGIATTIAIIYGGILYITSAGEEQKASKGRAAVINGVIGSIIVLLAWVFMGIVQRLVRF